MEAFRRDVIAGREYSPLLSINRRRDDLIGRHAKGSVPFVPRMPGSGGPRDIRLHNTCFWRCVSSHPTGVGKGAQDAQGLPIFAFRGLEEGRGTPARIWTVRPHDIHWAVSACPRRLISSTVTILKFCKFCWAPKRCLRKHSFIA